MPRKTKTNDYLLSSRVKKVVLPKEIHFDGADFKRFHEDLVISDRDGNRVFIRGFFEQENFPLISCEDGEQMTGDLAAAFVKLSLPAVTALLEIDKAEKNLK